MAAGEDVDRFASAAKSRSAGKHPAFRRRAYTLLRATDDHPATMPRLAMSSSVRSSDAKSR
jgi:hypothetical protein